MKKYVFLFLVICLLMIKPFPIAASTIQTIELTSQSQMTVQVHIDQEMIRIVNKLPYDIQMNHFSINSSQSLLFSFQNQQDITFEDFQNLLLKQTISSQQAIEFVVKSENNSVQDISFLFEWFPIMIDGYMYENRDGITQPKSQVKIDLWQQNNLIDTTYTNDEGYYQFQKYQNQQYCLKIPDLNDYTIVHSSSLENKNYTFTFQEITQHHDFLLSPVTYHVTYHPNGGEITSKIQQKVYSCNTSVEILSHDFVQRQGYHFKEWNESLDGHGQAYHAKDIMNMPAHDVVLYAIWEKDEVQTSKRTSQAVSSIPQKAHIIQVETSDDTSFMVLILLLLISVTIMIVMKVLKTKENR